MSRVPLNHGNVPLFVRSRIFFAHAQFVTLPRCPDVNANHPIERNYGNSVRFLAKIPNGTAAESPCYSVFWNAIDFCRLYTSKKNLNVGPANRPAFCRQVPLFYAKRPSKTFSRLAGLHTTRRHDSHCGRVLDLDTPVIFKRKWPYSITQSKFVWPVLGSTVGIGWLNTQAEAQ